MAASSAAARLPMPAHHQIKRCVTRERGVLVFSAPELSAPRSSLRVQILDVLSLQIVSGYTRDPNGRLLLESQPALAAGRSWSLARAAQLIRDDVRPHRWVALHQDHCAWGLFWAGGGLQHCRALQTGRLGEAELSSALVPATAESLLQRVLDFDWPSSFPAPDCSTARPAGPGRAVRRPQPSPWRIVAWTSMAWLAVLGLTVAGLLSVLERQDRQLERLQQQQRNAVSAER